MKERLNLLTQAGVISQPAYQSSLQALAILDDALTIDHSSEQYQMAITHLARAADRIWQNEAIEDGLDPEDLAEIQLDTHYPQILNLHQRVLAAANLIPLPASEESYLLANVFALVQASLEEKLEEQLQ